MPSKQYSFIPNSTPIPHVIIRQWMPLLKDVELRVLLVVADQTVGWVEDKETGRRKEKDWISQYQLMQKTGKSDRAVQGAVKRLVDELFIVQAHDSQGNLLDAPQKRMRCGYKIYYRLNLYPPQKSLFDAPEKSSGDVEKRKTYAQPPKSFRAKKLRATKETLYTKKNNNDKTVEKSAVQEAIAEGRLKLRNTFTLPMSHRERTQLQESAALEERRLRAL